jgi:hypothetical protein
MTCPECHTRAREGAVRCEQCGFEFPKALAEKAPALATTCPECGHRVSREAAACPGCGEPLRTELVRPASKDVGRATILSLVFGTLAVLNLIGVGLIWAYQASPRADADPGIPGPVLLTATVGGIFSALVCWAIKVALSLLAEIAERR